MTKFNNVRSITIFFPNNFADDDGETLTRITYIGFKGEWMAFTKEPIVTIYELNANPADHPKTHAQDALNRTIQ
jgi:hypothetical protein